MILQAGTPPFVLIVRCPNSCASSSLPHRHCRLLDGRLVRWALPALVPKLPRVPRIRYCKSANASFNPCLLHELHSLTSYRFRQLLTCLISSCRMRRTRATSLVSGSVLTLPQSINSARKYDEVTFIASCNEAGRRRRAVRRTTITRVHDHLRYPRSGCLTPTPLLRKTLPCTRFRARST